VALESKTASEPRPSTSTTAHSRLVSRCTVATDIPTSPPPSPVAWVALTIDCPNAEVQERLCQFYSQALGGEVVSGAVRARGSLFIFEVIPDYKPPTWPLGDTPKQMHFELMVHDLDTAVRALQAMGATLAEYQRPDDGGVRVMLDPAGHPFCVATAADVTPVFLDEAGRQQR
jgi:catechol 2,3-dioxygenase-like lactoylglutathione lyase family enzyme